MSDAKHTPTPWITWDAKRDTQAEFCIAVGIKTEQGTVRLMSLPRMSEEDNANAEFIVRACNAYEDLLAALQRIAHSEPRLNQKGDCSAADMEDLQRIARRAIAKAEGRA